MCLHHHTTHDCTVSDKYDYERLLNFANFLYKTLGLINFANFDSMKTHDLYLSQKEA